MPESISRVVRAQALNIGPLPVSRHLFSCRLCWHITLVVFGLILAVESAILIPSATRFRDTEIARLAHAAQLTVEPVLLLSRGLETRGLLTRDLAPLVSMYGIETIAIFRANGERVTSVGATPSPEFAASAGRVAQTIANNLGGAKLEVAWKSDAPGSPIAVVRIDSGGISSDLVSYLLRISGLVALIVLVVTAGTMLVLHRWVLRPLLHLRYSALAAGVSPDRADAFMVKTTRRDELGELIAAHNALLERVAASKRRDHEIAEERTRFLTRHDPLTRLPNRTALIEHVDGLARVRGDTAHRVSLLLIELAQFSTLQASAGPRRCDDLLGQIAAKLRRAAPREFAAHFGGEHFALINDTLGCDAIGVSRLAEAVLLETAGAIDLGDGYSVSPQLRIGIARSEGQRLDGRTLLNQAELALAGTRASDDAHYLFYSAQLAEASRERQSLARDLKQAIAAGELYPVFQPKMALTAEGGTTIAGAEVLLRWHHATRGMVPPDVFIALAESNGLIAPIGEQVLRAAAKALRGMLDRHGWAPLLAVNLSAQQFADAALVSQISAILTEAQVPAHLLELEITETAAMKDAARTASTLAALRAIGVRVAIDDFGTGYSSLSYLRCFAVDAIKIDKSFVDDIGTDANAEAVCDAILRLGKSLRTKIVAEGVENSAQLEFLRARRCDEVQGYFFSKPLPLDIFEKEWVALRTAA